MNMYYCFVQGFFCCCLFFLRTRTLMLLHLSKHFSILRLKNVIADECFPHMFTDNSVDHQVNL